MVATDSLAGLLAASSWRWGAGTPAPPLGGQPADVFGSSGGAVVGLALVTAHPDQVRTLAAHEPAVVELLADSAQVRAQGAARHPFCRGTGRPGPHGLL
ncbi:MAG TPA: hypothetical protein VFA45_01705 [Actinomycetes bacterium]|nr:hypothetical protein [Actinomycetes bacterium]